MFIGSCFKENCRIRPYAKCECEAAAYFCKDHGFEHAFLPSTKGHQLISLYFKPSEEIKQSVIQKLTILKEDLKVYKNEAAANASEVISAFNAAFRQYLDQISIVDKKCSQIIERLLNDEEFLDFNTEDEIESVLKLNISRAKIKMAGWSPKWCYLDFEGIKTAISKTYENPFNPFTSNGQVVENEVYSDELSYFLSGTSNFHTWNLANLEFSSDSALSTQENIYAYTSTCILPDYGYFYCCNSSDSSSGIAFIVDKNKIVKHLKKSQQLNSYLNPIFYANFIYLIGGNNKIAERYYLEKNLWKKIASLPQDLDFSYSCNVLFGDWILISSYNLKKIIFYRIPENDYKEIPNLILNSNRYKFMLKGNDRIYLFERGNRIYESGENDIANWTHIGHNDISNGNPLHQSVVVRYNRCLYFVEYDSQLWKFDLSSKQLSKVKALK